MMVRDELSALRGGQGGRKRLGFGFSNVEEVEDIEAELLSEMH